MPDTGVSIFYSYCHKDERFCEALRAHLSSLERKGTISSWYDRKIVAGQSWEGEIDKNVKTADIVLLLVSSDFVASDYCYEKELRVAMERHEANQAIVVPIIIRPVDFSETPFSKIQALPKHALAITKWQNEDEAWLDVVSGLKDAIDEVRLLKNRASKNGGFKSINQHLIREINSLEQAFEGDQDQAPYRGLATGIVELDQMTDGLHTSDLIAVAGRPGMGKTDFALKVACNVALSEGKAVAYFSLNLPVDRLMRKMICALGRVCIHELVRANLDEEDWPRLTSAVSLLKDLPLYIDDNMSLTIDELRDKAIESRNEKGVELIIIDSLQHINFNSENVSASSTTKRIRKLARELKIPILVTTSISRDLEKRPNKRPLLQDLGEWRSIEEDSDTLLFIYRDDIYNCDSVDSGLAEIIITKNGSGGPLGTVKVYYLQKYCSFESQGD